MQLVTATPLDPGPVETFLGEHVEHDGEFMTIASPGNAAATHTPMLRLDKFAAVTVTDQDAEALSPDALQAKFCVLIVLEDGRKLVPLLSSGIDRGNKPGVPSFLFTNEPTRLAYLAKDLVRSVSHRSFGAMLAEANAAKAANEAEAANSLSIPEEESTNASV